MIPCFKERKRRKHREVKQLVQDATAEDSGVTSAPPPGGLSCLLQLGVTCPSHTRDILVQAFSFSFLQVPPEPRGPASSCVAVRGPAGGCPGVALLTSWLLETVLGITGYLATPLAGPYQIVTAQTSPGHCLGAALPLADNGSAGISKPLLEHCVQRSILRLVLATPAPRAGWLLSRPPSFVLGVLLFSGAWCSSSSGRWRKEFSSLRPKRKA